MQLASYFFLIGGLWVCMSVCAREPTIVVEYWLSCLGRRVIYEKIENFDFSAQVTGVLILF